MERRQCTRIVLAGATAVAVVVTALAVPIGPTDRADDATADLSLAAAAELDKAARGLPHVDPPGIGPHRHDDPATKNLVSRAGFDEGAVDPTTAQQKRAAAAYVERERARPDPRLTTTRAYPRHTPVPRTRYAMAGACYTLRAPSGSHVVLTDGSPRLADVPRRRAARFYFKATRLGGYLLHHAEGLLAAVRGAPALTAEPSADADWTVRRPRRGRFTLRTADGAALRITDGRLAVGDRATRFRLRLAESCSAYPEAQVNVRGAPHRGVTSYQEVRGYVDAHTHGMAFEFLGGKVHCGRPWHRYGAPYALVDCPDHRLTGGNGALLEAVLSGEVSHDPVGWPTFVDWPAPDSLTHEGTYYRWLERSWRGGQRLLVNLLVENNKLCQIYPLKRNSCDDMDSIRLQAEQMYAFQDYIDAQFGGPGKGFYRIVRNPFQARRVINAGKMAVVMGIETSIPFGCTFKTVLGKERPACSAEEIDAQLDEMRALGVRQMELVNKFDNALAGVAGDAGEVGLVINTANFLETGSFWRMEHCEPADGESADNPQVALPDIGGQQQDALFGAVGKLFGVLGIAALPLYPRPAHCNKRGLTDLGDHTIRALAERRMIFDPDHLSVKARQASMDVIEGLDYPGVISSHSWSTPDTYPRIYESGGFITPYAGDSTGFVSKWRRHQGWADPRYYWAIGFGADINGLGAQGDPRGADVANPVRYPFDGLGGVQVHRQRAGERVWDVNVDGVAQYGLYPDWIEDLRQVADAQEGDGDAIVDDMARGTEAYLQMWERAVGVAADSCRNPALRLRVGAVRQRVRPGMTTRQVMRVVGQPFRRLGTSYAVCARTAAKPRVMVTIRFDRSGRVVRVSAR